MLKLLSAVENVIFVHFGAKFYAGVYKARPKIPCDMNAEQNLIFSGSDFHHCGEESTLFAECRIRFYGANFDSKSNHSGYLAAILTPTPNFTPRFLTVYVVMMAR